MAICRRNSPFRFTATKWNNYPFQDFRNVPVPKNNEVESTITGGGIQNVTRTDFAALTYGIDLYHRDWWGTSTTA